MRRLVKSRATKAGLPPGTPIHVGERKQGKTAIALIEYNEGLVRKVQRASPQELTPPQDPRTVWWINVDGLHEVEVLSGLGEQFGLHPLVIEDILHTDQRPKLDDYGQYLFVVLKSLYHANEESGEPEIEQISLVLGPNYVLSFQEREGDEFEPVRERIRSGQSRIRKAGADYLAYTLIDVIVDQYFAILERLGDRIDALQETLLADPSTETLQVLRHLKREVVFLRRSIWPLREVIARLERDESPLIQEATRVYLRDVYDHTIQVIDTVETLQDVLSGMLDVYLSSVSNRMNEVMKVLTIIATLFIPLTFIAGVYGMNFKFMPELEWRWGYALVWAIMIVIAGAMLAYFHRKRWL